MPPSCAAFLSASVKPARASVLVLQAARFPSWGPSLGVAIVLGVAYFAAGKFGLSLAFANESASAVWPPTGVAIAALIVWGRRFWPAVFVGAFLVNVTTTGHVPSSVAIAAGNTLEAFVAAWLVARFAGGRDVFSVPKGVRLFTVFAALLAPVLSASVGVGALLAFGLLEASSASSVWATWWAGDATGALLFAPPIILWAGAPLGALLRSWRAWVVEVVALSALLVVGATVMFTAERGAVTAALTFLALVPVGWAAMSFGPRGAATAAVALSGLAIFGTLDGRGPFLVQGADATLALLQGFIAVVGLVGLGLASVDAQRAAAVADLERARQELESRVSERTASLREAFARIEANEANLRKSQEIARVGSWDWDIKADRVVWSDELHRIFGVSKSDGAPTFEDYLRMLPSDDREMAARIVRESLASRQPFAFDHGVVRPDGERRVVRGRGEVLVDAEGTPVRMVGTAQDITEMVRIEAERAAAAEQERELARMREHEEFRSHLLGAVSHELKTPLTPLKMQVEMLRTRLLGPLNERQERSVGVLARNLARLEGMVEQTLDVARIQEGTIRLRRAPVEVGALVREVVETYAEVARSRGVSVRAVVGPGLDAPIEADGARLTQVLLNLVSNAVKFSPENAVVSVEARLVGGEVEVRVVDEGVGIRPADVPRLFRPFSQLAEGEGKGGTGLGLYISRGIVEAHGGSLGLESEGEGHGATFWFRLPLAPPR